MRSVQAAQIIGRVTRERRSLPSMSNYIWILLIRNRYDASLKAAIELERPPATWSQESHKRRAFANRFGRAAAARDAKLRGDAGLRPRKFKSQPVSRVLSRIIIHLDWKSPPSLKRPTRKRRGPRHGFPIWSCSGWGLPCRSCYHSRGALLPHPFTLTSRNWRSTLCCTGRGLSPPRRYLAPCPVEPGLSSGSATLASAQPAIIQLTARILPDRQAAGRPKYSFAATPDAFSSTRCRRSIRASGRRLPLVEYQLPQQGEFLVG